MKLNHEYQGKFCCISMESAQKDDRWMVDYDPERKTHFLPMIWPDRNQEFHFNYCPWCGKFIRAEFLDTLDDD